MTIRNKDFIKIFEILNNYFKAYINQEDKKQTICLENIKLHQVQSKSLKRIYITRSDSDKVYELWINESPHFNTEYLFFYKNEYNNKVTYYFKDLEEEITNSFVLDGYAILLKSKIIMIEKF